MDKDWGKYRDDRDGQITTEGWREEENRRLHLSPCRAWTGGRAAAATGKGEARSRRCSGGGRSTIRPSPTPTRPAAGSAGSATPYLPPYPLSSRLGAGGTALAHRAPSQPSSSLWSSSAALPVPSCSARTRQLAHSSCREWRCACQRYGYSAAPPSGQREYWRTKTSGAILLKALIFFFLQPVYLNTLFKRWTIPSSYWVCWYSNKFVEILFQNIMYYCKRMCGIQKKVEEIYIYLNMNQSYHYVFVL